MCFLLSQLLEMDEFLQLGQSCIRTLDDDFVHDYIVEDIPEVLGKFGENGKAENIVGDSKFDYGNFDEQFVHVVDKRAEVATILVPHELEP